MHRSTHFCTFNDIVRTVTPRCNAVVGNQVYLTAVQARRLKSFLKVCLQMLHTGRFLRYRYSNWQHAEYPTNEPGPEFKCKIFIIYVISTYISPRRPKNRETRSTALQPISIITGHVVLRSDCRIMYLLGTIPTHKHPVGVGLHVQLRLRGHITLTSIITYTYVQLNTNTTTKHQITDRQTEKCIY